MYYGTVLGLVFLHLALLLAINAYWLLGRALLPALAESAGERILERPVRTMLAGVAVLVPVAVLGLVLLGAGPGPVKMLGAGVLFGIVLVGLVGSAGLVERIGGRLSPGDSLTPLGRILRGGAALSLGFIVPFVGFFVLGPTLAAGVGGALHHALQRRKRAEPPQISPAVAIPVASAPASPAPPSSPPSSPHAETTL